MSNYSQTTFFAPKDLLAPGNPAKVIFGAQVDPELAAIAVAIATKYDSSSIASGQIAFADGNVGAPSITFASALTTGLYKAAANSLGFAANGLAAGSIASTGAWSIGGAAIAQNVYALSVVGNSTSGQSKGLFVQAGTTNADSAFLVNNQANTLNLFQVIGNGESYIQTPPAATAPPGGMFQVGYMDIPPNGQAGNYGFVLTDRGRNVQHQSASAHTWTIPANSSVAFPVGTSILVTSTTGAGAITLAITTDTLIWAPSGSTGSRTLTTPFVVTLFKVSSTTWYVTGVGIS